MLMRIELTKDGAFVGNIQVNEYIELGRRDKTDFGETIPFSNTNQGHLRWVIADTGGGNKVPRKVCAIDPVGNGRVRVTNIHASNKDLWLVEGAQAQVRILPGETMERGLPLQLHLPEGLSIGVELLEGSEFVPEQEVSNPDFEDQLKSILGTSGGSSFSSGTSFSSQNLSGSTHTVFSSDLEGSEGNKLFLHAMKTVISALQQPIDSPEFFKGIAKTVIRVMDMDRVEIITRQDDRWVYDEKNQFLKSPNLEPELPSKKLLERVLASGTVSTYPDDELDGTSESLMEMQTAIASPLLNLGNDKPELLGVLYADRTYKFGMNRPAAITNDEKNLVAILSAATANRLESVKKEKELSTYQQFFSQKVIDNLLAKGDTFLEGKDTEVSVLFCDIRGFSKATDSMEANAAMMWLSDTLSELSGVVLEADGVLVDYVGDELFAMWGAPEEEPSHGYSAARAAMEMMRRRKILNDRYKGKIGFEIDFGIGLNTGRARVGNTGSRQKFKYGPMGRTVNLGSRIQGLTKQWKVSTLMADSTAQFVPSDMLKRRLCKARVVGLDGYVELFQLMSEQESDEELVAKYEEGLELFESGKHFRRAARLFGELVQQYPDDGPSLIMLECSVKNLVNPGVNFTGIWEAPTK
jgi:adenylate cyclase